MLRQLDEGALNALEKTLALQTRFVERLGLLLGVDKRTTEEDIRKARGQAAELSAAVEKLRLRVAQ